MNKAVLVHLLAILEARQPVDELHIDWVVVHALIRIELLQVMLDEVAETVIERRAFAIATLELVPSPRDTALVLLSNQLNLLHLILLVQELLDEFLVLDVPMVQGLDEVLFEYFFKLSQLVKFLVLQFLQFSSQSIS